MDNTFRNDGVAADSLCGLALTGPGSGVCRDSQCGRRAAVLIAGYCAGCASKHGLSPLTLTPPTPTPSDSERCCSTR